MFTPLKRSKRARATVDADGGDLDVSSGYGGAHFMNKMRTYD